MHKAVSIFFSAEFARFVAVGGIALVIHWLSRFVFSTFMPFSQAVVCAYAIGIGVAYILNRQYVFPKSGRGVQNEVAMFVVVNVIAFPVVWGLSILLGNHVVAHFAPIEVARAIGHGAAICAPVFMNFVLHKFWTFRSMSRHENPNA